MFCKILVLILTEQGVRPFAKTKFALKFEVLDNLFENVLISTAVTMLLSLRSSGATAPAPTLILQHRELAIIFATLGNSGDVQRVAKWTNNGGNS